MTPEQLREEKEYSKRKNAEARRVILDFCEGRLFIPEHVADYVRCPGMDSYRICREMAKKGYITRIGRGMYKRTAKESE